MILKCVYIANAVRVGAAPGITRSVHFKVKVNEFESIKSPSLIITDKII